MLDRYTALLLEHTRKAGLMSASADREQVEVRHIPEALALAEFLDEKELLQSPAVDIGSGGGLPGIPLAIHAPDLEITLLEATEKKASFLEFAIVDLGLSNVTVLAARAEQVGRDEHYRGRFRLATARAVAPLPVLLELALPLLAVGGVLAALKGSRARQEVLAAGHALETLGGSIESVERLAVAVRNPPWLVVVRKVRQTPGAYPRRPGIPAKRPL